MVQDKNKLKSLLKELEKLKAIKDGGALAGLLYDAIGRMQDKLDQIDLVKGDKGDTPQRGIDYMMKSEMQEIIDNMARKVQSLIRFPKDGEKGKDADEEKIIKSILKRIAIPKDGRDADENKIIEEIIKQIPIPKDGLNGVDGSPDQPEEIRNKLERLEDDERLPIKAIDKLQEELDKLKKHIDGKVFFSGGGSVGGGKTVKAHDISDQLNGVLKTFGLPAFWRVISVVSSSFPTAFRPTVDYTTDASASTITFTSEIDAASTLSAGQTIIITYAEN